MRYLTSAPIFFVTESNTFLNNLLRGSWIVLGSCVALQCLFFPGWVNLMAMAHVFIGWVLVAHIYFKNRVLKTYPLSSFLVLGFCCTQLYFPLLFTTIEAKPLVYNLDVPAQVFMHTLLALIVLLLSHWIYRSITFDRAVRPGRGSGLLKRLHFFTPPSNVQVWMMGLLGLGATFVSSFILRDGGDKDVGVLGKMVEALAPFTYAPFFIPFGKLYGQHKILPKGFAFKLIMFTIALFVVSIGKNSRGAFMIGFTSLGFAFALGMILGVIKIKLITWKNIFFAVGTIWLLTGPFSDLGKAMVIVRHQRNEIPKSEFIRLTWEAFKDKKLIRKYDQDAKLEESDWDETYLDNIFLARFCNIKFNDASLLLARDLGYGNADMRRFSTDRVWTILPQPLLNVLHPRLDKEGLSSQSFGDQLRYLVVKNEFIIGFFVTGHLSGTGMAAFGWWYLLILALAIIPAFFLLDLLHVKKYVNNSNGQTEISIGRRFSLCALVNLTAIFQFLPAESVMEVLQYLIRGWFQLVLLYAFLFFFTQKITEGLKNFRFF
ncbi:hypothetical protein H8S90_09135 [Olivibacter sp. SDN3]|uniref:hypothetical protein n=1 Tax=Olivibacter sp. SDN3 TaxID=2764720 RepID=UPI001651333D|nr:hypothetical protein [Olivibacter sp. SDN3]QNL51715.1 hypothetical protein H8S90_09135 [Olivibacter sp. SDN3]